MSEAPFDYSRAARDAGWMNLDTGRWIKRGAGGCYDGTVRELCLFLGIGPEFEAWKQKPYVTPQR